MRIKLALLALFLLVAPLAMGQAAPATITNSDVISMTKAGIGEQTIILAIQRGPVDFDTSPKALIVLKGAGVSDPILNAMLASDKSKSQTSSIQQPAQSEESTGNGIPAASDDGGRVAFFTRECNKGDMDACANLGTYYRYGWGVSKDLSQAMALFKEACDGGSGSGCRLQDAANSSSSSTQNAAQTSEPPATSPPSASFVNPVLRTAATSAIGPASNHPTSQNYGGCAKNISFAVADGGQIVSRTPQFTQKWIEKNQKKYSGLCFSQIPNSQATNYVLVFSTSRSSFNGIFPTVVTSTSTNYSPVSGSGTITSNSGSMWNYTYEGTETTTTTTSTEENLPYTDTTSTLYVNAYSQNGALISQRWRSITTRQGGEGANTLGYNLGAALAAIHIKERLLKDAVEDVAK